MLYYILFFFVALGAKLLLALITIYLLFPTDRCCNECDGDTLLVRPEYTGRTVIALLRDRVQWRWCPRCGWEGWTRISRDAPAELQMGTGESAASHGF